MATFRPGRDDADLEQELRAHAELAGVGVTPLDPVTLVSVPLVLLWAALLASYVPARGLPPSIRPRC